jgi:FG-GAP repeat protein
MRSCHGILALTLVLLLGSAADAQAPTRPGRSQAGTGPRAGSAGAPAASGALEAPLPEPGGIGAFGPGTVFAQHKLGARSPGFTDTLDPLDAFGTSVAGLGDIDGDGTTEIAVGAPGVDERGAVFVLSVRADGTLAGFREIGPASGDIDGAVPLIGGFGSALAVLDDLDGDGIPELAVGAPGAQGAVPDAYRSGLVYVLFLAADGSVRSYHAIGAALSGFTGVLDGIELFGSSLASLDDMDGDGVRELAVGARFGQTGTGQPVGAVWVLFLDAGGRVKANRELLAPPAVQSFESFGRSLAFLGDLDGDGVGDVATADDGVAGRVWVLLLNADGSRKASRPIGAGQGGFTGALDDDDHFGGGLLSLGDRDGDGVQDLLVGAPGDDDGGADTGALWVLHLNPDGTVRVHEKLTGASPGLAGWLEAGDAFGSALAALGDLDGDGQAELAVGASSDDDGGTSFPAFGMRADLGAVQLLYPVPLAPGLAVRAHATLGALTPGFESTTDRNQDFGRSVVELGDLDGNGVDDLAIGAPRDDEGSAGVNNGGSVGAVWVLLLGPEGEVVAHQKISAHHGGLSAASLDDGDNFGCALAPLGDLDGDGCEDLAVGALGTSDASGVVWILFLNPDGTVKAQQRIGRNSGGFVGTLPTLSLFGSALAALDDLDGDGVIELAVGGFRAAPRDAGAAWVLFLRRDGTVKAQQKIAHGLGGFGPLDPFDEFGTALASLGDLDGDGVCDLAVGAPRDDDGAASTGTVWILFLATDGTVRSYQKVSSLAGGLGTGLQNQDLFGSALACVGDLDCDGVAELAVGLPGEDEGPVHERGSVWVLFLRPDGTVRARQAISGTEGGFAGGQLGGYELGSGLAALGDRNADGLPDLAVGALGDTDGGLFHGAVWLLDMDGLARVDFERGPELTALVNGQALVVPTQFGPFALTSAGANLGPALFDSTPLGPNDPSQDRDLLVGSGNVLILQNSLAPTQTVPGVFDRPNDDQDGGTLRFAFPAPVRLAHVDLIDVDRGAEQAVVVVLRDAAGRTRTYQVPAGWTGDLLVDGAPARGTLDLTTLDPQPGRFATATASESPGFDEARVVVLEAELGSSGALDELCFSPHPE